MPSMKSLSFSAMPGARERHLMRRYQNPLFPEARRHVSEDELQRARSADRMEETRFLESLKDLLTEVTSLSAREETEVILGLKGRIDHMYEICAGLGGEHSREKAGLTHLNEVIMKTIRSAAGNDALAMEELNKEQAARELHMAMLEYKIVPDLLRDDSFIDEDELVPSLLYEEAETIRMIMSLFTDEQRRDLLEMAQELVSQLDSTSDLYKQMQDRLAAMQAPPQ